MEDMSSTGYTLYPVGDILWGYTVGNKHISCGIHILWVYTVEFKEYPVGYSPVGYILWVTWIYPVGTSSTKSLSTGYDPQDIDPQDIPTGYTVCCPRYIKNIYCGLYPVDNIDISCG